MYCVYKKMTLESFYGKSGGLLEQNGLIRSNLDLRTLIQDKKKKN